MNAILLSHGAESTHYFDCFRGNNAKFSIFGGRHPVVLLFSCECSGFACQSTRAIFMKTKWKREKY